MKKQFFLVMAASSLAAAGLATLSHTPLHAKAGSVSYLEKTFSTDGIADATASANFQVITDSEFNGLRPLDGGQVSYVTYEINTNAENAVFTELTLTVDTGRFAYYFGDFGVYFDMYISSDSSTLGTQIVHAEGSGEAQNSFSKTVTDGLSGGTLYVSFGFSPKNPGCGYDVTWTVFDHFTVTGEESEITDPTVHSHHVGDNWRGGSEGSYPGHSTASTNGLAGDGNTTHGSVVGSWGASLSVEAGQTGYAEYHLQNEGEIITDVTFAFTAKFNNMGNNEMHWGDMMKIRASFDGNNYLDLKEYRHTEGEGITTVNSDEYTDSVAFNNLKLKEVWLRLELTHNEALSNIDLNLWGMKLFATEVNYQTKDGLFINYSLEGGTLPEGSQDAFFPDDGIYSLPTPTRDGYQFDGWYSGETLVESFNPSLGESLNVTAKWSLLDNSHSIIYHGVEGITNPNPETYSEGDSSITLIDLEKTGYTFLGFYDAETDGNKVETIDTSSGSDVELWARFEEKSYTITYEIDEHVILSSKPENVLYTGSEILNVSAEEGYGIARVTLDGAIVNPDAPITILGSEDKNHTLEVISYELHHVCTNILNEDYSAYSSNDRSFAINAYEYSNLVLIHDGEDGAGLCKMSEGDASITYRFDAKEGHAFNGIHLTGLARLFDLNGKTVNFTVYVSTDNENFQALKEYTPINPQDGAEKVDLAFDDEIDKTQTLYVKVTWGCESAGLDWVVLKKLAIHLDEIETGGESSSIDSTTDSNDSSSSSETPVKPDEPVSKGGCGGEIVGTSVGAIFALTGIVLIASKKRKK